MHTYRTINSSILQLLHEHFPMIGQPCPVRFQQAAIVAVRHNTCVFEMLGQKIIQPHRIGFAVLPRPECVPRKTRNRNNAAD
jgi:hypothetical protein